MKHFLDYNKSIQNEILENEITWNITNIKWNPLKEDWEYPSWIMDILTNTYSDENELEQDLNRLCDWFRKPKSHFVVKMTFPKSTLKLINKEGAK